MPIHARPELLVTYNEQRDTLQVCCETMPSGTEREIEPGITLHYGSDTRQVVGLTVQRFLKRFPLVACTLPVEEHGAAVAREYFAKYPVFSI